MESETQNQNQKEVRKSESSWRIKLKNQVGKSESSWRIKIKLENQNQVGKSNWKIRMKLENQNQVEKSESSWKIRIKTSALLGHRKLSMFNRYTLGSTIQPMHNQSLRTREILFF
jgi:hypothetical protein